MSEPYSLEAVIDVDGLAPPDAGKYRDVIWHVAPDPDEDDALVLQRPLSERELFRAQVTAAPEPPTRRDRFALAPFRQRRTDPQGWPHRPMPRGEAQAAGLRLRDVLPKDAVRDVVDGPAPVRLRIALGCSTATSLPWEMLAAPDGTPVALRPDIHVIRDATSRYPRPPVRVTGPLSFLLVVASPKDEQPIDIGRELDVVTPKGAGIKVEQLIAPTFPQLRETLSRVQPHVVHYVGHAGKSHADGFIILHDERSYTRWISASELAMVLTPSVRLLCLDTCVSQRNYEVRGLARIAGAAAPLPTTIANLYAVTEDGARAFWSGFHAALIGGEDVVAAAHAGRRASDGAAAGTACWSSYALWLRDVSAVLFERTAVAASSAGADLAAQYMLRLANDLASASGSLAADQGAKLLRESADLAQRAVNTRLAPPVIEAVAPLRKPESMPARATVGTGDEWVGQGVLIHPQLVVTPAHLGSIERVRIGPASARPIKVAKWIAHPSYQRGDRRSDVALLVLSKATKAAPARVGQRFGFQSPEQSPLYLMAADGYEMVNAFDDDGDDRDFIVPNRTWTEGQSGTAVFVDTGAVKELVGILSREDEGRSTFVNVTRFRTWIAEQAEAAGFKVGGKP